MNTNNYFQSSLLAVPKRLMVKLSHTKETQITKILVTINYYLQFIYFKIISNLTDLSPVTVMAFLHEILQCGKLLCC